MTAAPPVVFLFETTHHALWAEEVVREHQLPAEIVPAPPDARAGCGLGLQCLAPAAGRVEEALGEEGVPYTRHG